MKQLLLLACALSCALAQTYYDKFQWSTCNKTPNPAFRVSSANVVPMPIRPPGDAYFSLNVTSNRVVSGNLKGKVNMIRTVGGIRLPLRCYTFYGRPVGSCEYTNICQYLEDFAKFFPFVIACPEVLVAEGIHCSCPLTIPQTTVVLTDQHADLPRISNQLTWLSVGNYDVEFNINDDVGEVGCWNFKMSIQPK